MKRKEKRIIYHFGNGYRFGRDEDEEAKLRNQKDISPIPDWIQGINVKITFGCFLFHHFFSVKMERTQSNFITIKEGIISGMESSKLVPPGWIDSVEIIDFGKNGYRIPSVDPVSLFLRPSFTFTLLADSAVCFGAKLRLESCGPVFSDPRFRLPAYRGVIYKLQGYASDTVIFIRL